MSTLSLKTLAVASKDVEVEYPNMPGFKVKLVYLSRESLISLRKKATKITYKRNTPIEEYDAELFAQLYVAATVKGWSGLTLEYLARLLPIDLGIADITQELPYSPEEALLLTKGSTEFDAFVAEVVGDLGNFQMIK